MTTLSDMQMAGLLEIVIAQYHDILDLHSSVLALVKLAQDLGGAEEVSNRFGAYKQTASDLPVFGAARVTIERLEAMSLQLRQAGPVH